MATSAAIGMKTTDESVRAIYLRNDGYAACAGAILGGWYDTAETAESLLRLGNLAELYPRMGECVPLADGKAPQTFESAEDYRINGKGRMNAEYLYLFADGRWLLYGIHGENDWIELEIKMGKDL